MMGIRWIFITDGWFKVHVNEQLSIIISLLLFTVLSDTNGNHIYTLYICISTWVIIFKI